MSCLEKCQDFINKTFHNCFGWWGALVARRTCLVFWISIAFWLLICKFNNLMLIRIHIYTGAGYMNTQTYTDETLIWSPTGNESIVALDRSKELFGSSAVNHFMTMIVTAKPQLEQNDSDGNLKDILRKEVPDNQMTNILTL